jgi:hypothetical protein
VFVFWKIVFWKLFFKFSCVCLLLEKLVNGKYFPFKEKFGLISRKIFFFYFGRKTLFRSCEKFRNIYHINLLIMSNLVLKLLISIYFVWIFFFSISSLKIWFNLIFILTLVLIFMIVIYFSLIIFLIEIFCLSNLIIILLIVTYFIKNNLWNCNYYYFNFIIF